MAGLQSATPKLIIIICSDRVSENFTRLSQNTFVRGLRQEDAILTGALFDVQTDATVGTFVSGRHHIIRANRGIETISIRCAQRYGLFKVLYLRLSILVFEDSGTTGHLVRTGFQTDEGLRFTGLRGFGHVGILRTGGLRQRIVDLIHVVEGLGHHHGDFTVVLTLHVVLTKCEVELRALTRCIPSASCFTGHTAVYLSCFSSKRTMWFTHIELIRCIGRNYAIEEFGAVGTFNYQTHLRPGLSRIERRGKR